MTCYTCTSDHDPPGSNLAMRSTVNPPTQHEMMVLITAYSIS
jgi:hypothetical protein